MHIFDSTDRADMREAVDALAQPDEWYDPDDWRPALTYRLWVNEARTVMVNQWSNGECTVATRDHPSYTWGPPSIVTEEKV